MDKNQMEMLSVKSALERMVQNYIKTYTIEGGYKPFYNAVERLVASFFVGQQIDNNYFVRSQNNGSLEIYFSTQGHGSTITFLLPKELHWRNAGSRAAVNLETNHGREMPDFPFQAAARYDTGVANEDMDYFKKQVREGMKAETVSNLKKALRLTTEAEETCQEERIKEGIGGLLENSQPDYRPDPKLCDGDIWFDTSENEVKVLVGDTGQVLACDDDSGSVMWATAPSQWYLDTLKGNPQVDTQADKEPEPFDPVEAYERAMKTVKTMS